MIVFDTKRASLPGLRVPANDHGRMRVDLLPIIAVPTSVCVGAFSLPSVAERAQLKRSLAVFISAPYIT